MKPITVNQLKYLCEIQIKNGNGNKVIMISSDDEGNSYHYLWFAFTTIEEMEEPIEHNGMTFKEDFIYTSDNVAPKKDTIILG